MGFVLKKFVTFWLMPLPFCLTLLVVGWLLLVFSKRQRTARSLLGLGAVLLLLFSNKLVSTRLLQPLEQIYPAVPELTGPASVPRELAACRYVAVLGGGHGDMPGLSALNKLSTSARGRLAEAVRLLRALPEAQLIVSGHTEEGPSHAAVLADAAVSLGVERSRIVLLETPRDTEDEAAEIRRVARDEPVALVTSAWHLRRALALMRHAGVRALPCPADFAARPNRHRTWSDYTWDTESLGRSTWAVYERLGYLWIRLRGRA